MEDKLLSLNQWNTDINIFMLNSNSWSFLGWWFVCISEDIFFSFQVRSGSGWFLVAEIPVLMAVMKKVSELGNFGIHLCWDYDALVQEL